MKISNDIRYIGVNDHEVDLFEGQYVVDSQQGLTEHLFFVQIAQGGGTLLGFLCAF